MGATLMETPWRGIHARYRVICAAGHECQPRPNDVQQGKGICPACAGSGWDVIYVVTSQTAVKFGITGRGGRPRLARHRGAGYRTVVRLLTGLPDGAASSIERDVKATLRLAGFEPIRGREYFDVDALAVILDVVDSYPTATRTAA
jgi:hypothetical protein